MTMRGTATGVQPARRRLVADFAADRRGSVTIQIIIFSLLLFGAAGLVLDSGRVYTTHSQMQAFADQMALVAANELDGRDDAIQRATNAVFGFDGSLPFMHKAGLEVGDFTVERLMFYATMAPSNRLQNDMTEAFPPATALAVAADATPSYVGGDAIVASNAAAFVVVGVRQKEMKSIVGHIANSITIPGLEEGDPDRSPNLPEQLEFSAVAAASMQRTTCADLSTLVLCNPWEEISPSPLDVPEDDLGYSIPGRSLMYFAPNYSGLGLAEAPVTNGATHGSLYPWNVTNELFRLTNPVADPSGICSMDYLLGLADEDITDEDSAGYMEARDRCLMARARNETVCWGPGSELSIAPAGGDMISRSLNTIFDNWLPPFKEAITNNVPVGATGVTRAQFYEPDKLGTTFYESADRFGPDPMTDPKQDGLPDYNVSPYSDTFSYFYDTVPMPGMSMLLRVYALGVGHDICHENTYRKYALDNATGSCANDFIGDYYEGGTTNASTTLSRLRSYWQNMYYPNTIPLPANVTTWYELYQFERDNIGALTTFGNNSRILQYSDDNRTILDLPSNATKFVKKGPVEYTSLSGSIGLLNPGYERRRIRSAFVNCRATTEAGANDAGSYEVAPEDLRVMDVYLPQPPGHFCGYNEIGCELEDSIETRLYVELIEDVTDDVVTQRFVAQLVR